MHALEHSHLCANIICQQHTIICRLCGTNLTAHLHRSLLISISSYTFPARQVVRIDFGPERVIIQWYYVYEPRLCIRKMHLNPTIIENNLKMWSQLTKRGGRGQNIPIARTDNKLYDAITIIIRI